MDPLAEKTKNALREAAQDVLVTALHLFRDEKDEEGWFGRTGGAVCFADDEGNPLYVAVISNSCVPECISKYVELCQEKALRLGSLEWQNSSWESRKPQKDWWGGAVRIERMIYSFSGLPELGDEAVMLVSSILTAKNKEQALLRKLQAEAIAEKSSNPYFELLLNRVFQPIFD